MTVESPQEDPISTEYVKVALRGAVGWLTLNDPTRLNPVTPDRIQQINRAVESLSRRDDVAVVVVTGEGRGFCSGADLSQDDLGSPLPPASGSLVGPDRQWTLAALPQPVVAMVNGPAVGYGCELALQADIRIAAESAVFSLPFVHLGTVSDTGAGSWLLPRLIGQDHAAEMIYTGRRVEATEAGRLGLVTRVVPDEALLDEVNRLVASMASGSHWSLRASKRMLWAGLEQRQGEHVAMQHFYQETPDSNADVVGYAARFRKS